MSSTGLLIVSNIKNIRKSIAAIRNPLKNMYVHINSPVIKSAPSWSSDIARIYMEFLAVKPNIDVRVLVASLKRHDWFNINNKIDYIFFDTVYPDICEDIQKKLEILGQPIYLTYDTADMEIGENKKIGNGFKMYDTVVLGGTFDRIHVGHKIMLTESVLRANKKVVVGVTDENMIKTKKLWELILPVEKRIEDVNDFLHDIDPTLQYEIVPIQDPYGPTKVDPQMDLIIVSAETMRGGQSVNRVREENGLKPLEIHCIKMIETPNSELDKENKVSSSNTRMDLLGIRLKPPQPRQDLPSRPYIIGLTGGIASGKSIMRERLMNFGAFVVDCDKLAHEIYEPGKPCYEKIVDHFGKDIIGEDKKIDRKKLGSIVFNTPEELEILNGIVWPELLKEVKRRINDAYTKEKFTVAVIEAAILIKAGWESECHEIWSMIISPPEAINRLKIRNNLSEEEAATRLKAQLDNKTIVDHSNIVFSSEWSYEFTQKQAEKAWSLLMKELNS